MLITLEKQIQAQKLFTKKQSLLLAISGGIDSVVLAHLLTQLKYKVSLAHCNFKLRGKESDGDEKFCRDLAQKLNLKIYVQAFDVKNYCKKNKISVQMAARELRYTWFENLRQEHHHDLILTAHHADDSVETILLNLVRGSSLKGLSGMQTKSGNLIRPLLGFTKKQIETFATKQKIKYRKDSSNDEDKYKRNFVRLNLIPQLKKLNPSFEETLLRNSQNIGEDLLLLEEFLELKKKALITIKNNQFTIEIERLLKEKQLLPIAKHLLFEFGFNASQSEDLVKCFGAKTMSGKMFKSKTHSLYLGPKDIIILKNAVSQNLFHSFQSIEALNASNFFKVQKIDKFELPKLHELIVCEDLLIFPLILRQQKTGDKFKPFGMKGFKLLSDYFKEQKMNAIQKRNTKILVNGNGEIIWIVGLRSDDRYKVDKNLNQLLKIQALES